MVLLKRAVNDCYYTNLLRYNKLVLNAAFYEEEPK